jgi:predicted PurR-regulated permease PerM
LPSRLPWPLVFQVLGVVAALWLVVHTWQLWVLGFTALILAAAILPAARLGQRYRVPRAVTVLLVYAVVIGIAVGMELLLWRALSEQWRELMAQLPQVIERLKQWFGDLGAFAERWGATLPSPDADRLQGVGQALIVNTLRVTAGVLGAAFGFLTVVVIATYIVIDAEHLGHALAGLLPARHRAPAAAIAQRVVEVIGAYVRGQIAVSLCVGAILAIGMSILGVRYGLLIGALAAVLNVVPFVGSLVASVLGIASALNDSIGRALATALLFWGTNLLEAKLLVPQLVGRATGLHPLAVLFALLAGAHLAGLIGALVAVPLVAAGWEIVLALYVRRGSAR